MAATTNTMFFPKNFAIELAFSLGTTLLYAAIASGIDYGVDKKSDVPENLGINFGFALAGSVGSIVGTHLYMAWTNAQLNNTVVPLFIQKAEGEMDATAEGQMAFYETGHRHVRAISLIANEDGNYESYHFLPKSKTDGVSTFVRSDMTPQRMQSARRVSARFPKRTFIKFMTQYAMHPIPYNYLSANCRNFFTIRVARDLRKSMEVPEVELNPE